MNDLQIEVRGVFAEVTRYPVEILDPQANLEEDLGIDSVKLSEVFSVLRERFHLPQDHNLARESLATISGITRALAEFIGANGRSGTANSRVFGSGLGVRKPDDNEESSVSRMAKASSVAFSPVRVPSAVPQELDGTSDSLATLNGNGRQGDVSRSSSFPLAHNTSKPNRTAAKGHYTDGPASLTMVEQSALGQISGHNLVENIRDVFAEVTRYPKEILDPQAGLEEDLGIDSVKLSEVFSVLREKYRLPTELNIPRESLGTISGISVALRQHLAAQLDELPAIGNGTTSMRVIPSSTEHVEDMVTEVFAEVTRYPKDILDPEADLESDLGIDSVKLGEVFSVLRERYQLPNKLNIPVEQLRSIHTISAALESYVGAPSSPATESMPASPGVNGIPAKVQSPTVVVGAGKLADIEPANPALYPYEKPNNKPFTNKILFVSGSGRGLGKDIAVYLAELGATVVINSFHSRAKGEQTAEEIRDRGGAAIHLWGSMANPEHVHRVFDEVEARYGGLDFFVGNASNGMLARLEDITVEHWEKAYRTNVIGLHQSAVRAVKLMRSRGGGKIITLSSPAAHGYVDYFGCMGAVKAAVESLTRSMAIEFAPYNIQVNCVSPGPVYGELLKKWPDSDRLVRQWESNTAYNRLCEARDISHFIAYLLSEPVKLFTGSVLVLDGGISSQGW